MLKGVAAMIEVARALVKSECQLKYSVIFVAFDKEEVGVIMVLTVLLDHKAQLVNINWDGNG